MLPNFIPAHVPISWYLILSALLFVLGVAGFLLKRNIVTVFMSIELMLNAVNLSFVAFGFMQHTVAVNAQVFVFFVMVVAAAEAAVGLAIIIMVHRNRKTLNVDDIELMKF